MAKDQKQDQPTLFGKVDQVFNCLHTELTIVNEEIGSSYKRIASIKEKIKTLERRKAEIEKAIKIVKPRPDEKEISPDFPDDEQKEKEPESADFAEEDEEQVDEISEQPLNNPGENSVIRCPNCNALILKDAGYCPGCGQAI